MQNRGQWENRNFTPDQVPIIMGVAAIALLGYGIFAYRRGKATLRWRPVPGKITWSIIVIAMLVIAVVP